MKKFQEESQLPFTGDVSKIFRNMPGIHCISENWETEIAKVATEFRGCRNEWFSLCIHLTRNEPSLRQNPTLSGTAEVSACIYQLMDALDFVAERQYVQPAKGQDFANLLYAAITHGQDVAEKSRLSKKFYSFRQEGQGMDRFSLCSSVTEQILSARNPEVALKLSCTLPLFTNLNRCIVALSFGDQVTLKRLEKETERLAQGT